jgi:uncharacterized protein YndB with AHSA1/START domain
MPETKFKVNKEELTVEMERTFKAPRESVFRAFLDPDSVKNWWGPEALDMTIDKMDVKPGGKWRFIHKDPSGNTFAFNGEYKNIEGPDKITQTFNYEGLPGNHELVETVRFEEEEDGHTKVTSTSSYKSIEDLEGMVASGMESGAKESWERLAKLVEKS